ncbi:MAG TPA: TlpA disulfide reductase family protein [Pyrinomonadaceae bacterium]|nr:TlpA disulfide reductase family protein [Pyrinomonadaceae bacterium]
MKRNIVRALIFSLLLVSVRGDAVTQEKLAPQAEPKQIGFRLKGIDGKFYDTSEMRGQVLVVSFGATWCVPCTWEQVAIEELKVEYAGKPVKFLWVSIEDQKRTTNNILRHYVKERRMTVPVLRDPGGEALAQFATGARVPVTSFFGTDGRFDAPAHRGMPSDITVYKQLVRDRVNALLKAQPEKNENAMAQRQD